MAKKLTVKKAARTGVAKASAKTPIKKKSTEDRYLEFLRELNYLTKTKGGFKSFAPLIKNHGISKNVSAVLLSYVPKCIIKNSAQGMNANMYVWIDGIPTKDLAISLVKDVKKYTDKIKAKKLSPTQLNVNVFTENISVPEQLIDDVNNKKSEVVELKQEELTKKKIVPELEKLDVDVVINHGVSEKTIHDINSNKLEVVEFKEQIIVPVDDASMDKFNAELEKLHNAEEFVSLQSKVVDLEKEIKILEYSKENIALTHRKLLFDLDSPDFLLRKLYTLNKYEEAIVNSAPYAAEVKKWNQKIEDIKEYQEELKKEISSLRSDKEEIETILEVLKSKWRFKFLQFITGKRYFKKIMRKAYLKMANEAKDHKNLNKIIH